MENKDMPAMPIIEESMDRLEEGIEIFKEMSFEYVVEVMREVDEESSVTVEILGRIPKVYLDEKPYHDGFLKIHASVYACKYLSGNVKLGEPEHVSYRWMGYEEAKKKIWLKLGRGAIEKAIKIYESSQSYHKNY